MHATVVPSQLVRLSNKTAKPQQVWLEPLGDRVPLQPGGLYELTVGGEFGEVEIELSDDGFVVYGWVTRVVSMNEGDARVQWELPGATKPFEDSEAEASSHARVTVDRAQMGGVPCVRGLRIPVATVVGMIAMGMSSEQILEAYPDLEAADIAACMRYAAHKHH